MALPLASPFALSLRASITTVRCSLAVSNAFSLSRSFSLASSFSGSTLGGLSFIPNKPTLVIERKRPLTIVAGKKYSLGQTKRNRSKKSLARVHGFRIRMRTTSGRKLLKRRRDKGRKVLCPKSHASSGKKHMGYGRRSKKRR